MQSSSLQQILERYPELGKDIFQELHLEELSEEQKNNMLEAYYENVGTRFFEVLLSSHLTDEQKDMFNDIVSGEDVEKMPVLDFLQEYVPDWFEILQVQMAQAKLDLINTTKRIQEMAKQIVEQQAPAQSAEAQPVAPAPMPVEPQPVEAPEQPPQEPTPLQQ
ncbi:MAG: hypothetical protein HZA36_02235 [Parcubacteria group bacterium]|nr:hypothetical protein [Parcubacteria group bacterium]